MGKANRLHTNRAGLVLLTTGITGADERRGIEMIEGKNEPGQSAPVHAIVSQRFIECPFPDESRVVLLANGATPLKAIMWRRIDDVAYGLFSADPSGKHGETEKHLSVSASTRLIGRRMPTMEEVEEAAKAVGLDIQRCSFHSHKQAIHLFCPSG